MKKPTISSPAKDRKAIIDHINSVREEMTRKLQLELKYVLIVLHFLTEHTIHI